MVRTFIGRRKDLFIEVSYVQNPNIYVYIYKGWIQNLSFYQCLSIYLINYLAYLILSILSDPNYFSFNSRHANSNIRSVSRIFFIRDRFQFYGDTIILIRGRIAPEILDFFATSEIFSTSREGGQNILL